MFESFSRSHYSAARSGQESAQGLPGLPWVNSFREKMTCRVRSVELVHRLISGRHTAAGDLADFQGASDEHTEIRT